VASVKLTAQVGDESLPVQVTELDDGRYEVLVGDRTHVVDSRMLGPATYSLIIQHRSHEVSVLAKGDDYAVEIGGRTHKLRLLDARARRKKGADGSGDRELRATMPGKVVAVLVEAGAKVERGHGVLVIEAMKMENEIAAPRSGEVKELRVKAGQAVEAGELLAIIE